jgi:hypothetical protein
MTLTLQSKASEQPLAVSLKKEISEFKKRNSIVKHYCCPRCLNAHIINKALSLTLGNKDLEQLKANMKEGIGHDGYYLDNNELIKL